MMKLVVIESPLAGDRDRNKRYVDLCIKDCLLRGEAPFAGHALYDRPAVLDDRRPEHRSLGMSAHFAWARRADTCVVYQDLGVSGGMEEGIKRAKKDGIPVERRNLPLDLMEALNKK